MKIKSANKLPVKPGLYWYNEAGCATLTKVYLEINVKKATEQLKYRTYSALTGFPVDMTEPKNWSERIEFE